MADCWEIIAALRGEYPELPIGLLVYANLVLQGGAGPFYAGAARAGVDSVLVADAPLLESRPLERAAIEHEVAPVLIAAPTIPDARLEELARRCRGYIYVTARPGVTGTGGPDGAGHPALRGGAADVLRRIRALPRDLGAPPPLVGFGIDRPDRVAGVLAGGAAGAIVGSAIVQRVERVSGAGDPDRAFDEIESFAATLKSATLAPRRERGRVPNPP
jgi:tryptophan synthase alpha chain